jgi:hypothetical protein
MFKHQIISIAKVMYVHLQNIERYTIYIPFFLFAKTVVEEGSD